MALALSPHLFAAEWDNIRFHGFVSQGIVFTDRNQFFGDSESTSWEFTDLGFGALWRPNRKLQLSGQGIYRQTGDLAPTGINLDYAMLNYSFINTVDYGIQGRIGRLKNPTGIYNETRDIASTRSSILLPQSIYRDELRSLGHSSDSVGINAYWMAKGTLFTLDLIYGSLNLDESIERALIDPFGNGEFDGNLAKGARLIIEPDNSRFRLGVTASTTHFDVNLQPIPGFTLPLDTDVRYMLLSIEYTQSNWQLSAEYQINEFVFNAVPGLFDTFKTKPESYYLQFKYDLTDKISVLTRYDTYFFDKQDRSGDGFAMMGLPRYLAYAKDTTLGVRYEPNQHWLFSAEVHSVRGTAWLPVSENPIPSEQAKQWNIFLLQASYKF